MQILLSVVVEDAAFLNLSSICLAFASTLKSFGPFFVLARFTKSEPKYFILDLKKENAIELNLIF